MDECMGVCCREKEREGRTRWMELASQGGVRQSLGKEFLEGKEREVG